ncbi:diaminobutyrate--2-oxoglutarate transaminase [Photorhabdus laumondii]|uniref:Diaminobutyrate--2-oxoglutarate transaminase n=1 Tax=Photorhabdus laumondii subsp. clarkei TaxID=2029685 RepID=A0A329VPD7_9GAMM|nr:diaminobutyrate--2-oxoglutarate transaminase [Photorhabdus laumondii]RAW93684.1 diaminobutyrate--2-oxoglutarate transaminase [Photorhabdus laumondii subsp. clarkei]
MSEQNQTVTLPDKKDIGLLTEEGLWDNWLDIDAVKKLVNHPLLIAMSEERITLSGMRYFLIQHHYYSRNFTRFLCALISHIDNFNDIHHLMENLREEMGVNGEGKVTHAELFQRSLMETGAQVSSIPALEETSHLASCVLNYCRSGEIADGLAALCLGAEAIVPMIYKPVLHALTHLGVAERGLEFFKLHIEEDEDHAITMMHILHNITENNEQLSKRVRAVGKNTILLRCRMFDAVYENIKNEIFFTEDACRTFEKYESNVRSYCRNYPVIFTTASNALVTDKQGKSWIDFLSGAGSLNYGHNNPRLKSHLIEYIEKDGITHSLDLYTNAKRAFIESFNQQILKPRGLQYRFQFTGPTGTNAVEAAMKIARKVTGRSDIVAFTNAFHGMSLGALAATAREKKRNAAGVSLNNIVRLPFENFLSQNDTSLDVLEKMLVSPGSGIDLPAAIILETIQAEGGVNVASIEWLRGVAGIAATNNILLIVDDIQAGCGRTGTFFSFEDAGIKPDIICLAKSVSGYGLPMSLVLMKPELDIWQPGEHNGTFRGNNLAFIGATYALDYWHDSHFLRSLKDKSEIVHKYLLGLYQRYPQLIRTIRGKGMLWGLELCSSQAAENVRNQATELGLIIETCGPLGQVIKLLPPLTIEINVLEHGLLLLEKSLKQVSVQLGVENKTDTSSLTPHDTLFYQDEILIEKKLLSLDENEKSSLLEAQKSLSQKLVDGGLNFEGKNYPVSIRPLILSDNLIRQLASIGERFTEIFEKFAHAWVENVSIREYFPAYKKSEHYLFNLPNHTPLTRIFRLDGLFSEDGTYQILETNTDCPGGVIQNGIAGALWSEVSNPLLNGIEASADFQPFVQKPDLFLETLLETHRERTGEPARRAAIVTYKGRFGNEVTWMVNGLNRLGVPTEEIDASLLRRHNNKVIDPQGRVIDVAYNKLDLRDLIDEPEVEEYLTATFHGEVTFINPLICQWPLADKAIMAALSDPQMLFFLPEEEKDFCLKHIPWTRILRACQTTSPQGEQIDLVDWAIQERGTLVLKPSNATRGEGLLVGPFTAAQEWEATLRLAAQSDETWVIQRYIRGRVISAVHPDIGITDSMWSGVDTYVYGGRFAGFQARASFDPVMNVGRRGILLPVVKIKEA